MGCKVVQGLSLARGGNGYVVGGSGPSLSAPGCALPSLAQGWGLGLGGWHILFFLLWPRARARGGLAPQPGACVRSALPRLLCPRLGFLFGVVAVRVSTLRSGSRLVFGLFGLVRDFVFVVFFCFVTSGSFGAAGSL